MNLHKYKIVFAGKDGAGKTKAIRSLADVAVLAQEQQAEGSTTPDNLLTQSGIDYGVVKLEDGVMLGLYGAPEHSNADDVWSTVCHGAIGAVLLIDHSLKSSLDELEALIDSVKQDVENMAIGITHIDQDAQQLLKKYRNWADMHQYSMPIYAIDPRKKDDVLLMVEALIARAEVEYS